MLNVTKELTALARKLGYTGEAPDTVAKAINAITSVAGNSSGGGGVFIIEAEITESGFTLKNTWKEIKDAFISGKQCVIEMIGTTVEGVDNVDYSIVTSVGSNGETYDVTISQQIIGMFKTDSENGYPVAVL